MLSLPLALKSSKGLLDKEEWRTGYDAVSKMMEKEGFDLTRELKLP